jgi:hypothetical protein
MLVSRSYARGASGNGGKGSEQHSAVDIVLDVELAEGERGKHVQKCMFQRLMFLNHKVANDMHVSEAHVLES